MTYRGFSEAFDAGARAAAHEILVAAVTDVRKAVVVGAIGATLQETVVVDAMGAIVKGAVVAGAVGTLVKEAWGG